MRRKVIYHGAALLTLAALAFATAFLAPMSYGRLLNSFAAAWERLLRMFSFGFSPKGGYRQSVALGFLGVWTDWARIGDDCLVWLRSLVDAGAWMGFLAGSLGFFKWAFRTLMWLPIVLLLLKLGFDSLMAPNGKGWRDCGRLAGGFRNAVRIGIPNVWGEIRAWAHWVRGSYYFWCIVVGILVFFGVPSIAIDLVSYYFYLMATFDFGGFPDVIGAFAIYCIYCLRWVGFPLFLVGFFVCKNLFAVWGAKAILSDCDLADDKFALENCSVATAVVGAPRAGKTTVMTALALSLQKGNRDFWLETQKRMWGYFPDFPWAGFEMDLLNFMGREGPSRIVNMEQAGQWAQRKFRKALDKPGYLYGYDLGSMKSAHYDGGSPMTLGDAMEIDAQCFFLYRKESSVIVSNYSIRNDSVLIRDGGFAIWDEDSLSRDNRSMGSFSSFSHVVNYDAFRFGRKVESGSEWAEANGACVLVLTEFDKEYGNQNTNRLLKADADESNSNNDLFDLRLKLGGHTATVFHRNCFFTLMDFQRLGDLASKVTGVAGSVIVIDPRNKEKKTALRGFWLESAILDFVADSCQSMKLRYRARREDVSLFYLVVSYLGDWAANLRERIVNRFGYTEMSLRILSPSGDGQFQELGSQRYFIINYKHYAKRFESVCMGAFLNSNKARAVKGFADLPEFSGLMPTKAEWDFQRSHLVGDLEDPAGSARFGRRKSSQKIDAPQKRGRAGGRRLEDEML